MTILVQGAVWGLTRLRRVAQNRRSFATAAVAVFVLQVALLARIDLLPEPLPPKLAVAGGDREAEVVAPSTAVVSEYPMKIEIKKINLSTTVVNPTAIDIPTLDKALLKGAVRYPTSAKLGGEGNVVLFGHSSYLPAVLNPAYKAFNDIQKLKTGDTIEVSSDGTLYTYRVRSVAKESTIDAVIPLAVSGKVLTLSTCDSFGATTDRFVVTADFVESHALAS